jgi:sarcosine oxidase
MAVHDVAVIGGGVAGSAVAYFAAKAGASTILIDQFGPRHEEGSSHGATRIFRTAYLEGSQYVPLTKRAQELWTSLSRERGDELLLRTGALMLGPPEGEVVGGARRSAEAHRLPFEALDAAGVRRRFPAFAPHPDEAALFDPQAGLLHAEKCLRALREGAEARGAELRFREPVRSWSVREGHAVLLTAHGEVHARRLVLAGGPWMAALVPELRPLLRIERQAVFWFEPTKPSERGRPPAMPVFVWEAGPKDLFYGLPDVGEGVKVAHHGGRAVLAPDQVDRHVSEADAAPVRAFVGDRLPGANGKVLSSTTCLYTMAPGGHFLVGPHPRRSNVWVVSACSGHGFKFATAIGEAVVQSIMTGSASLDLSPFEPATALRATAPT